MSYKSSYDEIIPLQTFKVVVVGDSGVGKTSLIMALVNSYNKKRVDKTVGTSVYIKQVLNYSRYTSKLEIVNHKSYLILYLI